MDRQLLMVAEIDGRCCSEQKLSGFSFQVEAPLALIVGSDVTQQAESFMRIAEWWIYDRTLHFQEKSRLRDYVFDKYKDYILDSERKPKGVEFIGRKFLYYRSAPSTFYDDPAGNEAMGGSANSSPDYPDILPPPPLRS